MCIRDIYIQVFFKYVLITSVLQLHRVDAPGSDGRVGQPRRGRGDRSNEPAGLHRPGAATARTLRQRVPLRTAGQRGDIFSQSSQRTLNVELMILLLIFICPFVDSQSTQLNVCFVLCFSLVKRFLKSTPGSGNLLRLKTSWRNWLRNVSVRETDRES